MRAPVGQRIMRLSRTAVATAMLGAFTVAAQAPSDMRVALVIGNAAYAGNAALNNPGNDAKAMAETLRKLGFAVIELRDGNKRQMAAAIQQVRERLQGKQGIGMLYYAGHGLQLDWHNYMVPVDAELRTTGDVPTQTVDVNAVIEAFKTAGNRMNILVLDACRDSPFASNGAASGKGLAQLDAPPGTFLAFATAPGNVAEDGDASSSGTGHGLYTRYLLQELGKPIAKIEDVFKRVRLNVRQQSHGRQVPWESTSLEEDFFFNISATVKPEGAEWQAREAAKQLSKEQQRDQAFAVEKAAWDKIKDSTNPDDFYAFLKEFPNGLISEFASATLERLAASQVEFVPDRNGIQQTREARYRLGDHYKYVVLDGQTKNVIRRQKRTVTQIADGVVVFDEDKARRTMDGAWLNSSNVRSFDPPRANLPAAEFSVGLKWSSRSVQTNTNGRVRDVDSQVKIVALEDIVVPAGTFKAYKFVMESARDDGSRLRLTYWAEPGWGEPLRTIREVFKHGTLREWEIIDMTERRRGQG